MYRGKFKFDEKNKIQLHIFCQAIRTFIVKSILEHVRGIDGAQNN